MHNNFNIDNDSNARVKFAPAGKQKFSNKQLGTEERAGDSGKRSQTSHSIRKQSEPSIAQAVQRPGQRKQVWPEKV